MQTGTWLTASSYPDCCPLCCQPLAGGSNSCPSCGFTAHGPARAQTSSSGPRRSSHPATPIPARASARQAQYSPDKKSGQRAKPGPATSAPEASPTQRRGWHYDSPAYTAASSLSTLSLIIAESPTSPPRQTRRLEHIDEIDTLPSPLSTPTLPTRTAAELEPVPIRSEKGSVDIDEIDTLPEPLARSIEVPRTAHAANSEAIAKERSWTTAVQRPADSLSSHLLKSGYPRGFTLLDRARWWLLYPGRIEFLLWLVGSVLLFALTFLLLLATVLSLLLPALPGRGNFPTSSSSDSTHVSSSQEPGDSSLTPTPMRLTPMPATPSPSASTPGRMATPIPEKSTAASPLGNALNNDPGNSPLTHLGKLNPLVWVIACCYFLSLLLLSIAGFLRRRR